MPPVKACLLPMLFALLLSVCASEARKGKGRKGRELAQEWVMPSSWCTATKTTSCCGDGVCGVDENIDNCMADCPGVTTDETCGEEPHSDRSGKGRTFGVSHRAKSAQECCDKCKAWTQRGGCNSWTFCGYPVCFGLDTGWNHTYGECWLRQLEDKTKPTFGQRGVYAMRYRRKMLRTRKACNDINTPGGMSPGWVCPPTHVPWTSGSPGTQAEKTLKYQTGGGWGNMRITQLDASGEPIESTCTREAGKPCDPNKLDHAGRRRL